MNVGTKVLEQRFRGFYYKQDELALIIKEYIIFAEKRQVV
jgi:hypothetical protein